MHRQRQPPKAKHVPSALLLMQLSNGQSEEFTSKGKDACDCFPGDPYHYKAIRNSKYTLFLQSAEFQKALRANSYLQIQIAF